jgi:hypothetical protein
LYAVWMTEFVRFSSRQPKVEAQQQSFDM